MFSVEGLGFSALSPEFRGRNEVFRGLAKCQAVPSEGSAVPCTTEDPIGSEAEGVTSTLSSTSSLQRSCSHPGGSTSLRVHSLDSCDLCSRKVCIPEAVNVIVIVFVI